MRASVFSGVGDACMNLDPDILDIRPAYIPGKFSADIGIPAIRIDYSVKRIEQDSQDGCKGTQV